MGDMDIARKMIFAAATCGADVIKFQKRNVRESLTKEQYERPHPNPVNAFGECYGKHREYLEFDLEQHRQLAHWCDEVGIAYSASVWDLSSAKEIASLSPSLIKIPSACNNHVPMLEWLCENFPGELHVSLGMTARWEEQALLRLLGRYGRAKDTVLYACTSGYPVAYDDVCLLEIQRLLDFYGSRVKKIAFSGHHLGTAVDVAAFALGAMVIERHFTLDHTWKGTDQSASLEEAELSRLVRDLSSVSCAMRAKPSGMLPVEQVQRQKLKFAGTGKTLQESPRGQVKMVLTDSDGVLTDGGMYYGESGEELKKFQAKDGMGFQLLREKGILTGIITGEKNGLIQRRAEKLRVNELFMGVSDKLSVVRQIAEKYHLQLSEIAFVGDDVNDLECMGACGFSACPSDAVGEVQRAADYICLKKGGKGAFREVAERILYPDDL